MNMQKLNPWNWFKHEEPGSSENQIPIKKTDTRNSFPEQNQTAPSMLQLRHEIDRLFDDTFRDFGFPSLANRSFRSPLLATKWLGNDVFRANLNVSSDASSYVITLEAPGMNESDLTVEVKGDVLTIQGQKQEENEDKEREFYRVERSYGTFQRTLALPDDADSDEITANMKDGVLTLTIPRKEVADSDVKRISIN